MPNGGGDNLGGLGHSFTVDDRKEAEMAVEVVLEELRREMPDGLYSVMYGPYGIMVMVPDGTYIVDHHEIVGRDDG